MQKRVQGWTTHLVNWKNPFGFHFHGNEGKRKIQNYRATVTCNDEFCCVMTTVRKICVRRRTDD